MRVALVGTTRDEVVLRGGLAVDEALVVGLTDCDVAGGILVEERVVEKHATLGNARRMRHQSHFAQTPRAFVGIEQVLEGVVALVGLGVDDEAVLELGVDVLHHLTLQRQRTRAEHVAIHSQVVRGTEHFFSRDIGVVGDAVLPDSLAACPGMSFSQTHSEVGAGAKEADRLVVARIELRLATSKLGVVGIPGRNGVVFVGASGLEDFVPERSQSLLGRKVGEDLLGPGRIGSRRDVPVDGARRNVFGCDLVGAGACLGGAADAGGVESGKLTRDLACDGHTRGIVLETSGHALEEPVGSGIEAALGRELDATDGGSAVVVERSDERSAGFIGVLGDKPHHIQCLDRSAQNDLLTEYRAQTNINGDLRQIVQSLCKKRARRLFHVYSFRVFCFQNANVEVRIQLTLKAQEFSPLPLVMRLHTRLER